MVISSFRMDKIIVIDVLACFFVPLFIFRIPHNA